jgi:YHS domain-containing protein
MEGSIHQKRRWARFGLRTLFFAILLTAVVCSVYVHWVRSQPGLEGYCPVTLVRDHKWQSGNPEFHSVYEGRVYFFASSLDQRIFEAAPEPYAAVCSGNDVVRLIDENRTVPGERRYGVEYHSRIYLFDSTQSQSRFSANPSRYEALQSAAR